MAIVLPDARQLSDEVLEALRLRALRGCELGFSEAAIAEVLGVRPETVCRWWSAYADHGVQALPHRRTGRPSGSGRALTDSQSEHVQQWLRTHQPEEMGIAASLWSRCLGSLGQQAIGIMWTRPTPSRWAQVSRSSRLSRFLELTVTVK